jgi:GNAT superfamily N-acetyltransferase
MAGTRVTARDVAFRPARPADAKAASRLLFDSFPKMASFIIGLGSEERAKAILARLFVLKGNRFSFENTVVFQYQGRIAGVGIAFPGKDLGKLNRRLGRLVLKQYKLRGKLALIIRTWPLVFIKEAARDEYLLSNLAVRKRYHDQGLDERLLSHIEENVVKLECLKMAVMTCIGDKDSRKFYEDHGYRTKAIQLESNKRVPYFGAGYLRMVKELNQ